MKAKTILYLLALSAAAMSLNPTTASAQMFSAADVAKNRAVAASPRAREEFPWLTRETIQSTATAKGLDRCTALAAVTKNRALAASPRTLEEYPELSRPAQPARRSAEGLVASAVLKNRAVAASPRAREEFPWLARGNFTATGELFEVAPLK